MFESVLAIPFWLELIATLTGAVSGSMHAVKHDYDMFGVVCLACITGVSGGIIRDVLLQDYGIYAFQHWELFAVCIAVAVPVFFFCRLVDKLDLPMDIIDTVSIALWAIIGTGKGFAAGNGILVSAILGTITAVGGGCLRDVLLVRPPRIFICGTLYATSAFFGSFVYAVMRYFDVLPDASALICVFLILIMRFISVFFTIETKPPRDYSDKVEDLARKVSARFRRLRKK